MTTFQKMVDNMTYQISQEGPLKRLVSESYNYTFNLDNGHFMRWGAEIEDDPEWSPFGPEILDLEISTGECLGRCPFCYKENGVPRSPTKHMTLETFKGILDRMPPTLTQIALGLTDVRGNPDLFNMIREADRRGIKCNYTTHGLDMDDDAANLTAELCGAVAVSIVNKDKSYDTVQKLTDLGMTQVNIHFMLSSERIDKAMELVREIKTDPRLAKLNAVVFLQYKPKGGNTDKFTTPSFEDFSTLIRYCDNAGVSYGFDSCTAPMYMKVIKGQPNEELLEQYVEPCESGLFSAYINVDGEFFACSFCENEHGWKTGMNVFDYDNFEDLWRSPRLDKWRKTLLDNERACPMYSLGDGQSQPLYQIKELNNA
jgi:MoaA/NifB/PqqE/SkfB family radical SAM enzyme